MMRYVKPALIALALTGCTTNGPLERVRAGVSHAVDVADEMCPLANETTPKALVACAALAPLLPVVRVFVEKAEG